MPRQPERLAPEHSALIKRLIHDAVSCEAPLEGVLERSLELVCHPESRTSGRAGAVFYSEGDSLRLAAQHGMPRQIERSCARLALGQCLCGRVGESRQPLFCAGIDERHEIRYRPMPEHGHVVLPLVNRGNLVGVLNLYTDPGRPPDDQEVAALETIADTFALAISQRIGGQSGAGDGPPPRAVGEDPAGPLDTQISKQAFDLLSETARNAVSAASEAGFSGALARAVAEVGEWDAVSLALTAHTLSLQTGADSSRPLHPAAPVPALYPVAHFGASQECAIPDPPADGAVLHQADPLAEALQAGAPRVIEDVANSQIEAGWRRSLQRAGLRALCIVPLIPDGLGLGVMVVHARSGGAFTRERMKLLNTVADLAACAIDFRRTRGERDLWATAGDQIPESLFVTDREARLLYVNPAFERQTGFSRDEVLGNNLGFLKSGLMSGEFYKRLWTTLLRGRSFHGVFVNRRKDGNLIWEEKYLTPIRNGAGEITHFISTGRDITEQRHLESELRHLAYHDPLTALPNRRLLQERAEQMVKRGQRHQLSAALMVADLNGFKKVNDSLGHVMGDELLIQVGRRFGGALRDADTLARLGGDEFGILLPDCGPDGAARVAQRLLDLLGQPVQLADTEALIGAAVGIAHYPEDGQDAETLLRNADVAMYRAKARGGSGYAQYDAANDVTSHTRLRDEGELRAALGRREIEVHYQPIVDLNTGRPIGAEALARWPSSDGGFRSPGRFIPLAEESNLICELDQYMLWRVLEESACLADYPLQIAVNAAPRTLLQPGFPKLVARALRAAGSTPPVSLCIELTERTLATPELVTRRLARLHRLGVDIAVDDFGTGYSSLNYLSRYPLGQLKIDKSFVDGIGGDRRKEAIVSTIIELAHNLGLRTVAEGVETDEQRDFLQARHCDALQGFLIAKAMPIEALLDWLRFGRTSK